MLKGIFVAVLVLHGVIHALGFVKAFGCADLPQLTEPISRPMGVVWLLAGVLVLAASGALGASVSWFWPLGALAAALSQVVIFSSWQDAKFGTVANVLLLVASFSGFMMEGPFSFRARFAEEVARGRARLGALPPAALVTEQELVKLPAPVAAYLRAAGFVGKPQVRSYELKFGMRIRGGAHEPWMNGEVEQVSFADEPTRLFLLTATMYGLPVQALHHYSDGSARFQVRLGGFIPIVDAKGPIVDKTETVTLFNDMVMLAPGTLISPNIAWETLGDSRVKATFENGGHRISAELVFDSQGFSADFISDDRSRSSKDGRSFTAQRFSTPVLAVASYGGYRLVSRGEAHWHAPSPEGEFSYGEYELFQVAYNKPLQ